LPSGSKATVTILAAVGSGQLESRSRRVRHVFERWRVVGGQPFGLLRTAFS